MLRRSVAAAVLIAAFAVPAAASHRDPKAVLIELDALLSSRSLDPGDAARITALLEESVRIARAGSDATDGPCYERAEKAYRAVYAPVAAMEMAMKLCRAHTDPDIFEAGIAAYTGIYQETAVIEKAATLAQREDLQGRGALVRFAAKKYRGVYDAPGALAQAIALAVKVPRGAESCVERAFTSYRSTYDDAGALRMAADLCSK